MLRLRFISVLSIATLILACLPGCGELTEGYVYIDNGGPAPMQVTVDGTEMCTVYPGTFEKIKLDLGDHQFKITSGGRTIYDQVHNLDSEDRPYRRPTYVLNPDRSHRYCDVSILYGDDIEGEERAAELMALAAYAMNHRNDPTAKQDLERRIKREFDDIANDLTVFGDGPWIRFETPHNVLTPVPTAANGSRYNTSTERAALIRISKKVNSTVARALRVSQPKLEDLQRLAEVQADVVNLVPFRS